MGDELCVCALLDDTPLLKDHDEVGMADGGETVGYDEIGWGLGIGGWGLSVGICIGTVLYPKQAVESLLHLAFALGVEGTGCFVEYQ